MKQVLLFYCGWIDQAVNHVNETEGCVSVAYTFYNVGQDANATSICVDGPLHDVKMAEFCKV